MQRPLWNRLATFLVWLVVAGSAVFWGLKFVSGPVAPSHTALAAPSGSPAVDPQTLAVGLGGGASRSGVTPDAAIPVNGAIQASRFLLSGVVVNQAGPASGVALVAVDGKPPRPYRVGSSIADGIVLHSVLPGKAMLASSTKDNPQVTLELPQATSAVVGTALPSRPAQPPTPAATSGQSLSQRGEANPRSALEPKGPRFGANRQREAWPAAAANPASEPRN